MTELVGLIQTVLAGVLIGAAMIPVGIIVNKWLVRRKLYRDPQFRVGAAIASIGEKGEGCVMHGVKITKIFYGRVGGRVHVRGVCNATGTTVADSMTLSRWANLRVLYKYICKRGTAK